MKTRRGEKINFKYNFSEYWSFLKKYKLLFYSLLIIGFLLAARNVTESFLFKKIVDNGSLFAEGNLAKELFIPILIIILVAFFVVRLSLAILDWIRVHLIIKLEANIVVDLKEKYFNHILGLDHNFHTTHKTGSLISRLTRGTGAIENLTDTLVFNISPLIFNLIAISFSLILIDSLLLMGIIFGTVTLFISYSFIFQHFQQSAKLDYIKNHDIEKGFIGDIFTNIDSVKYFGKEKNIGNIFIKLVKKVQKSCIKYEDYYRWSDSGQIAIIGMGALAIIYFSAIDFLNGNISIGTLVFIYTVYANLGSPMYMFVHGMRGFYRSMADLQDLFVYGKFQNEIKDKPNAKNITIKKGEVEFRNVDFSYGKRKLLKNFNLKIKPNEKVALVGHSGCGKTTIVNLLNRLYDVNSGQILIDKKDIKDFKQESVRGETGIVPQECILFDDTIYNNIKFANPKASRKEITQAIKFAQLDKIIENFPKKENTIVGERGVKLSGGEKQRVSIARAILANKKILVLDEATSALDSQTEHEIQKSLQKLLVGRTSIIIAHRLSTIMSADRIIVMRNGKIIQQGKHEELIKQKGEYKKLWNLQKGGYIK
ncbi:MAG: ABC transporter ATP-binding protein/permease [Candidatus Pacearchaeota archaeon]|nr:ABC transporter ATP-binding protein/permease [Candidatus Pacearchaeota archaeon]